MARHNPQQLDFGFSELVEKPTPIARGSDPITSKISEAETKPKLNDLQKLFLQVLDGLGEATAREIQREVEDIPDAVDAESVRKRAGELKAKQVIKVVGFRHCKVTGKMASVYARRQTVETVPAEAPHDKPGAAEHFESSTTGTQ